MTIAGNEPEANSAMTNDHGPAGAMEDISGWPDHNPSTALLLTGPDGVVRRVVLATNVLPEEASQGLIGATVLNVFAREEHAFLQSLLDKARDARYFDAGSFAVRLAGEDGAPMYLSISQVTGKSPGQSLLAWRLSTHERHLAPDMSDNERTLGLRVAHLEGRNDAYRRSAEQSRHGLTTVTATNRSLSRALKAVREVRDHQMLDLVASNSSKDELIQRMRDIWATAVDARRSAEESRQRLKILAEASRTMGQSLDFKATARRIADLVAPEIADCCVVQLLDDDLNTLRCAEVACHDLSIVERIQAYPEYYLGGSDETHPLYRAMRTGSSVVVHDTAAAIPPPVAGSPDFLTESHELGITSYIITVLRSRERVFGTLLFASMNAARHYQPEGVTLAEEIAFRAGQALDNSMLYQEAAEASKARDRYLSMASHELRSPLTVVSGFGSLLLRQISAPELDREHIAMLGRELQRGVERLELLTDGLLASASLQKGLSAGRFSVVDLSAMVEALLTTMSSVPELSDNHIITLDAPDSIVGYWDAEGLERALSNIISNALKYTPGTGNVHVWVRSDGDVATIGVRDEGIGMSEDEQAELFLPFVRGRIARETAQGTGLGLYITKQIVEQHHGEIEVESQPGAGSTFTIRLPLNPAEM